MRTIEERKKSFINGITNEVSKQIAKKDKISFDQAQEEFKQSRTFNYLAYSDEPFTEEGPDDFFEMFLNDRKFGVLANNFDFKAMKEDGLKIN